MGKKAGKRNPEQKARRQLARAQLHFHVAQEKHVQARARGKQEVERARLKAARWLTKASQQVERCSEDVARAESTLRELTQPAPNRGGSASARRHPESATPQAAANHLERLDLHQTEGDHSADSVLPEVAGEPLWQE